MTDEAKRAVDIYLAEYNTLRSEQLSRVQTQNQAFNFLLIVSAAAITAVISAVNSGRGDYLPIIFLAVVLMLPLATCPLAFIFFDNEIMIHAIGSYLYYDRRPLIANLVKDDFILGSHLAFKYLPELTHRVFPIISRGRWVLFCLPTFLPLLVVLFYVPQQWEALRPYLGVTDFYSAVLNAAIIIVYIVDLCGCLYLGMAIVWIFQNAHHQQKQHGIDMTSKPTPSSLRA